MADIDPPILFHGTTLRNAQAIVGGGFRRGNRPSYTGTAINLAPHISTA